MCMVELGWLPSFNDGLMVEACESPVVFVAGAEEELKVVTFCW